MTVKKLAHLDLNRHPLVEPLLIALVFSLTVVMWFFQVETPVLLHLFYVPVVITGSLRGRYRARLMALLCVLTSLIIFVPGLQAESVDGIPLVTLSVFLLWVTTLVLIAHIVGSLSDAWRATMAELTAAHRKDVLTDALTNVANRRAYELDLTRRIAEASRADTSLSLIILDIDYFKKFNDRYGHQAGDAVLCAVASELQRTVRDIDLVARYGGEEFAVVMSGTSLEETKVVAERIRSLIESSRFPFNGLILRLTVSVGFAQYKPGEDCTSFVQRADAALYSSKETGRNCVHYHDGSVCQQFGKGIATQLHHSTTEDASGRRGSDPYTDDTTGLPTKKVFLEELRRRSAERNRYGTKLSLAIVEFDEDLENSTWDGHARKSLLATISKLASSVLRDTDLITRYNCNSLAILLPATELQRALIPLQRLRENSAQYHDAKYASLSYKVSIGAGEVQGEETAGSVLSRVEEALHSAIEQGGNCLFVNHNEQCQGVDPSGDPSALLGEGI